MYAAKRIVTVSQVAGRALGGVRTNTSTGMNTAPRVRISFPEKVAHGVCIFTGFLAWPVYVCVNIKNYVRK